MCTLPPVWCSLYAGLPSLQTDQPGPLQHQPPDRCGDGRGLLENVDGDLEHPGLGQPALGPKLLQIELLGGQGRGPGGQLENWQGGLLRTVHQEAVQPLVRLLMVLLILQVHKQEAWSAAQELFPGRLL